MATIIYKIMTMSTILKTALFIFIIPIISCNRQEQVDNLDLKITWDLETNYSEGGHRATWTIQNNSNTNLTPENWSLYWNMAPRDVIKESIEAPVTIEWINGDFYVMKPLSGFSLKKGEAISITYEGSDFMIKESDGPLGVYSLFTQPDGTKQPFPVADMTIEPFTSPDQINRDGSDLEPIPTAEWLYESNANIAEIAEEEMELLVPTPLKTTRRKGEVSITSQTIINYQDGLEKEADLLAEQLNRHLSSPLSIRQSDDSGSGIISLRLENREVNGSYFLDVSNGGVNITGNKAGVFYGSQSLIALIPADKLGQMNESITLPSVFIEDYPAFEYRGMFLDVSRNFNSLSSVKKLIDIMAFYKLNKLHIHLSEDEAWRIEIEELPELTQFAAFRGHTEGDTENLQPSYGSGPFKDPSSGYGSGYYTRKEYKDLIQYAHERHIEVIPEINVPGHSRAAIKAMEYRYRNLMKEGKEAEANEFRLADPDDTSKYRSAQWYTDNVICVCQESAFRFYTTVIDDILEMYEEAGVPISFIHTGGDEVPVGAWTGSPLCQDYMNEHPEIDSYKNLQKMFFRRVQAYLSSKGLKAGGWEEIAQNFAEDGSWTTNPEFANSNVVPYVWNSLWGAEDLSNKLANDGYPVVLCSVANFYFDLAYNKDPREAGLYWAGFVDTRDAFDFVPFDMFKSIKVSSFGKEYTDADFEGMVKLTKEGRQNILGIQAQLWSETVKGQGMMEYYILPKLMGLAERAWYGQTNWADIDDRSKRTAAADEAWNRFANVLGRKEFPRLDRLFGGYNYRLAPPGAKLENMRLVVNTAYPGMEIRYTVDGSDPTVDSPIYTEPLEVGAETIKLSTFDSRGRASLPTVIDLK